MPAVCRKGDTCTGHGGFPPRANDEGSPNVFVNGIPAGNSCHDGTLSGGSSSVFVNGKALGRIGDDVSCGSVVASGSPDVFSGG